MPMVRRRDQCRRDPFIPVADAWAIAGSGRADLWVTDSDGHLGSRTAPIPWPTPSASLASLRQHLLTPAMSYNDVPRATPALAA